jgi:Na+-transporting methylmalonyl-CoA/oxaloacetate decarboxylase gamma subunit
MHIVFVILFAFVGVMGCVQRSELIPAPEVSTPTEAPKVATAEVAGVRVAVTPDKWQDQPRRLPYIQDLHVVVENQSGIPLRLRYSEFELVSATGFTASPLPHIRFGRQPLSPSYIRLSTHIGSGSPRITSNTFPR